MIRLVAQIWQRNPLKSTFFHLSQIVLWQMLHLMRVYMHVDSLPQAAVLETTQKRVLVVFRDVKQFHRSQIQTHDVASPTSDWERVARRDGDFAPAPLVTHCIGQCIASSTSEI